MTLQPHESSSETVLDLVDDTTHYGLQPHESSSETLRALDAITGAVLTSTSREFV